MSAQHYLARRVPARGDPHCQVAIERYHAFVPVALGLEDIATNMGKQCVPTNQCAIALVNRRRCFLALLSDSPDRRSSHGSKQLRHGTRRRQRRLGGVSTCGDDVHHHLYHPSPRPRLKGYPNVISLELKYPLQLWYFGIFGMSKKEEIIPSK